MTVTKAYDLKELVAILKEQGVDVAEDAAQTLYESMKFWIVESAKISPNPYDDLGIPFMGTLDKAVLPQIDKINGKVG